MIVLKQPYRADMLVVTEHAAIAILVVKSMRQCGQLSLVDLAHGGYAETARESDAIKVRVVSPTEPRSWFADRTELRFIAMRTALNNSSASPKGNRVRTIFRRASAKFDAGKHRLRRVSPHCCCARRDSKHRH